MYLSCGTLSGRRRLFTTGGTSLAFGKAGLLAQRAALVSCETKEKFRSGPEVVRNTLLIFDFNPVDGGERGAVGMGISCTNQFSYSRTQIANRLRRYVYLPLQHFRRQFGLAAPSARRRPLEKSMPGESLDDFGADVPTAESGPLFRPQPSPVISQRWIRTLKRAANDVTSASAYEHGKEKLPRRLCCSPANSRIFAHLVLP